MPDKYVVVPRDIPAYGMVYDIVREGGRHPIAMTAGREFALIAAEGFTKASAESERLGAIPTDAELADLEAEWRQNHEQDREMRSRREG